MLDFNPLPPLRVIPCEYPDKFISSETRRIVLPDAENRTIVSSFLWTQYRSVTEWQTDGQTDRNGLASIVVCIAINADG